MGALPYMEIHMPIYGNVQQRRYAFGIHAPLIGTMMDMGMFHTFVTKGTNNGTGA